LFERAISLPRADQEAFVNEQASGDAALAEEVFRLLARANDQVPGILSPGTSGAGDGPAVHGDKVHSTATSALLARLEEIGRSVP
jgi:hypothetical protein